MSKKPPPGTKVNTNQAADDDGFVKIGGGGPWNGEVWHPEGPTEKTRAKAEEYGNPIVEDKSVRGTLHTGRAFNRKEVFFLRRGKVDLLLPEHGGLMADCAATIEKMGEGCEVKIDYTGQAEIKRGRWAGNMANTYDVRAKRSAT